MRRIRAACGGASTGVVTPPPPPPTGTLLWEPDYSSESTPIQTGIPLAANLNPGLGAGLAWDTFEPPFVRGVRQTSLGSILTGADVPGQGQTFTPSGCAHWKISSPFTTNDFGIIPLQDQLSTDTYMWMRVSDVQTGIGAPGDGLAYPGGPVPNANTTTANIGDSLTNQSTVSDTGKNEHVRVNDVIDFSATQEITYTGPTITNGTVYTGLTESSQTVSVTYEGATLTNGVAYTAVQIPIVRAQESTASAISAGDLFLVATGDVNNQAGFSSRTEAYTRIPAASQGGASTCPADLWPDPVFSERWYSNNYYLDPEMNTLLGQAWFIITQFKGQFGGSPPYALQVSWGATQGQGTWELGDGHPGPSLGPVTLGQWTRFVIGFGWDYRTPAAGGQGWIEVYVNPTADDPADATPTHAQSAAATMDTVAAGFVGNLTNGSDQVTGATISGGYVGQTVTIKTATSAAPKTAIPADTTITAISGTTLTLSNEVTLTDASSASAIHLNATGADPIYYKNGIYRSIAWQTTHNVYSGVPMIGEAITDVW